MAGAMVARSVWTIFKAKTDDFDRGVDRAKAKTNEMRRSIVDAGRSGGKAASIAGAGFSSLAAGIAASQASAASFETSMVSAAASVAAAFGAGGPFGAAMALGAIAIGTLIGAWKRAGESAEASRKKQEDAASAAFDEAAKAAKEYEKIQLDILELQGKISGTPFDRKAWEARNSIEATRSLVSERERQFRDAERKALLDSERTRAAMERFKAAPRHLQPMFEKQLLDAQSRSGTSVKAAQGLKAALEILQKTLVGMEQRQSLTEEDAFKTSNPYEYARRQAQRRQTLAEGYDPRTMAGGGRSRIIEVQEDQLGVLKKIANGLAEFFNTAGRAR